jgi:hypothetical protein
MSRGRAPARVLVIDRDATPALRLQAELATRAGRLIWLWHGPSLGPAQMVVSVTRFELIVLDPGAEEESLGQTVLHARASAPCSDIVIYADASLAALVGQLEGVVGIAPEG